MRTHFSITLDITIRQCQQADLRLLEWFGTFTPYRETIERAFQRQHQGEVVMLVAAMKDTPIGQLWIDLLKQHKTATGVLWAFRIFPPFQGMGIGSRLLAAGEQVLRDKGYATAEISVEQDNPAAKRLYERNGYQVTEEHVEEWSYTPPNGEQVQIKSLEWVMHKALR